jgi:hypothetical protein
MSKVVVIATQSLHGISTTGVKKAEASLTSRRSARCTRPSRRRNALLHNVFSAVGGSEVKCGMWAYKMGASSGCAKRYRLHGREGKLSAVLSVNQGRMCPIFSFFTPA